MKTCPLCHKKHRFFQWLFRRKCDPAKSVAYVRSKVRVDEDAERQIDYYSLAQPIPLQMDVPAPSLADYLDAASRMRDPIPLETQIDASKMTLGKIYEPPAEVSYTMPMAESPEPTSTPDPSPAYDSPSYDTGSGSDSSGSFDSPSSDSSGLA